MDSSHEGSGARMSPGDSSTVTYEGMSPTTSDRYLAKRFHARGGMGEVWLAMDPVIGREVALKHTREKRPDQHARFIAEARIAGQLEHPNIVPVHDIGRGKDGHPYYVMKFVHGRTLKNAIEDYHTEKESNPSERHLQWRRLLDVFVDLCEAVAYAHSRGVIHRDLKPENVMLGAYGETVVLDWGLAKLLHDQELPGAPSYQGLTSSVRSGETHAGSVIGSPPYMPPEMAEGRAGEADPLTDVYLLGATLYSILCGEPPRRGASHREMVEMARTVPPVPPRERNKNVPRALEAICLKAMAMRPKNRYASASDLASEIRCYLAGEPVQALPEGFLRRAVRQVRRHRRAVTSTLAAGLIVGLAWFSLRNAQEARVATAREQDRAALIAFRQLNDSARYALASTNPVSESQPYFDTEQGQQDAQAALKLSQAWGAAQERLSLDAERPAVRQDLYELMLLLVQSRETTARGESDYRELLDLLQQAAQLQSPSRGLYELEAELQSKLGRASEAERARGLADDPQTRLTAVDHFVRGEQHRLRSAQPSASDPMILQSDYRHEELEQAIASYEAAIKLDPNHFWSHFQLGRCSLALGNASEAIAYLRACMALRPDSPWPASTYGLTLAVLRRHDAALHQLSRVIEQHPSFLPARMHRGFVYSLQQEFQKASEDLDVVLGQPDDKRLIEAAYYRAMVHLQRADANSAIEDLSQLIRHKTSFRPGYYLRAQAFFLSEKEPNALADVDRFLALSLGPSADPNRIEWDWQRGRLLRRLADELKAAKPRRRALELALVSLQKAAQFLDTPESYSELGMVLQKLGRLPESIVAYTQGLERDPDHLVLRNLRGAAYDRARETDKASADFRVVAQHTPKDAAERHYVVSARARLGILQAQAKDRVGALGELASAFVLLRGAPDGERTDYMLLHNLACIYGELAKWDDESREHDQREALRLLEDALKRSEQRDERKREIEFIRKDESFKSLQDLPGFQQLIPNG